MPSYLIGIVISILSGIAATVPLVIGLVAYAKQASREKNWTKLLEIVIDYMKCAEKLLSGMSGSEKKEWVMNMVLKSSNMIDYNINMDIVSNLIDSLYEMSIVVSNQQNSEYVQNK